MMKIITYNVNGCLQRFPGMAGAGKSGYSLSARDKTTAGSIPGGSV